MKSLFASLLAIAAIILLVIFIQVWWSIRRAKKLQQQVTAGSFSSLDHPEAVDSPLPLETQSVNDNASAVSNTLFKTVLQKINIDLDPMIDAIATLNLDQPISGDSLLEHLPASRRAGSKPMVIEALNTQTQQWEMPQVGQTYGQVQAGVLMANRNGALNEIEFSEFVQKIQSFADDINAMTDFPDMLDVVGRARELDQFCSEHDAQLALRLMAKSVSWTVPYIQQHASRHGFIPGAMPGRLVLPSPQEGAPPVLTLNFDAQAALADDGMPATVSQLSIAFDVPQTAQEQQPFQAWCAAGSALALTLDAWLTDDAGHLLPSEAFAGIEEKLKEVYATLEAQDMPAGSSVARRLFS